LQVGRPWPILLLHYCVRRTERMLRGGVSMLPGYVMGGDIVAVIIDALVVAAAMFRLLPLKIVLQQIPPEGGLSNSQTRIAPGRRRYQHARLRLYHAVSFGAQCKWGDRHRQGR